MATIIDKPDALSLSGNMRKFVLGASGPVSLTLKKGEAVLIERSYEPGADGMITIDARDVVENQLSYTLDTANAIYSQHSVLGDFTAIVDGESHAFRAIRSGVANLADTPANWLGCHFLTWQPKVKDVTYYSPEWLTYYAVSACSVKVKATFQDKSTNTTLLKNMDAGECVTLNLQYAVISRLFGNRYPLYFEVWAETGENKLTESQFYKFSDTLSEDEQWFLFENSLGGLDTFRAYGVSKLQAGHEHLVAELGDSLLEYDVDTERAYTKNTGYLDEYARRWLLDFFPSRGKYVHEASAIRKIVVTESDASYSSSDLPSSFTFTYRIADVSSYLNLIRNESELPGNLVIPDPGSPDFIFPPRLAELPRIPLDEGVLIPAFDPHTPTSTVTSLGAVYEAIKNGIIKDIGSLPPSGEGGDGIYHIKLDDISKPSDENGFTALRTLAEIRRNNEILVGNFDIRYIRKDIDDHADGTISFKKDIILAGDGSSLYSRAGANDFNNKEGLCLWADGTAWLKDLRVKNDSMFAGSLSSPLFISGFPEGTGWMLAPYRRTNAAGVEETRYKLEIDDIDVRGRMRIHEFVVSQLLGENDNRIFAGMMEVDHYDPASGRIYLDTDGGRLYNPFRAGDICVVQQFQGKPTMENGYDVTKSYEFTVKAVGVGSLSDKEGRLDWLTFENLVGDISQIARRDTVVRVDSLTDTTRKGIIKITTIDEFGTPYMDVAYGMKTDPTNATKVRIGNLGGIVTPYFGRLDGYGGYLENLFARGKFILSDTGEDVSTNFKLINGRLSSEMSSLRHELSEKDNYLTNSSFSADMVGWEPGNDVSLYTVSQRFIAVDDGLYSDKASVAGIVEVYNRYALRIKDSHVRQRNAVLARKPSGKTELSDGTKAWPTFHASMMAKVVTTGRLTAGFQGQGLYSATDLEPGNAFTLVELKGTWDGTGDFIIDFTGEVYIYNLLLTDRPLDNFRIEMSTRLAQTNKRIGMYADKTDSLSATVTAMGVELDNTTESLSLYVSKTDNLDKTVTDLGIKLDGVDGSLSLFARKTDVSSLKTELSSAIQLNAEGITQKVSITDYTGQVIASKVNQTAIDYSIEASKINLAGKVTFSMLDTSTRDKVENKADSGSLGAMAYKNVVEKAMLGETIIAGGFIKTDLIDVEKLVAKHIDVEDGRLGGFYVNGKILVAIPKNGTCINISETNGYVWLGLVDGNDMLSVGCDNGIKGITVAATTGSKGIYVDAVASEGIVINSRGGDEIALRLESGCIAGLRVKTMRVAADYIVKDMDTFISCYSPNDSTIYLPSSPRLGDIKLIRRNTDASVNVYGNGNKIRRDGLYDSIGLGEGLGDMGLFLFDGLCWTYNVLLR